jgi:hypothetical protein
MSDITWSPSEKKIARRAFDAALDAALTKLLAEFKARAARATSASEMWDVEDYLREQRKHIDVTFDYRYSRLPLVFAAAIGDGYMEEASLAGLADEKLEDIRRLLKWREG